MVIINIAVFVAVVFLMVIIYKRFKDMLEAESAGGTYVEAIRPTKSVFVPCIFAIAGILYLLNVLG